jgi:bifunctional UDP-N-acetylglucosamine pyrophosphorylase/glucosamine-1-phosphate N-acetyltransferase
VRVRAIVLAAGKGTRMKSATPKVLHELCGRPMLWYVLRALRGAGVDDIVVVTNPELHERIGDFGVRGIVQQEQLGTGHAVQVALDALPAMPDGRIVIAYGDMPLVHDEIFRGVVGSLEPSNGATPSLAMVTVKMPLPSNFGRVIRKGQEVVRVVEARDASPDELAVDEMNAGIYAYDESALRDAAGRLRNENAQQEYYLTDTIGDFVRCGRRVVPVMATDHLHVLGINDRVELALARKEMNKRLCAQYMRDGVTIIDPDATYLEPELQIGRDTVIYPNTSIGRLSHIGERCVIGPNARLSGANVGERVEIRESVIIDSTLGDDIHVGPFAHLRNNTVLADNVHIGNFVEVKNSRLGKGVKAGHLTYLGDAEIGENTNVGAGTITCNYDGVRKNKTTIGRNAFIGSNSSLIAPVTIGDDALTGASAVVTKDVAPGERVAGNPARPLPKNKAER